MFLDIFWQLELWKWKLVTIILKHSIYLPVFFGKQYCGLCCCCFFRFLNDLPIYIKSEIELFAVDVELIVRFLSKEITWKDLNKLSYWDDIWKLKFNI